MIFKNVQWYRFSDVMEFHADSLETALSEQAFKPCSKQQQRSIGWVNPVNKATESFTHAAAGCFVVCAKEEQRVLPAAVVKEQLDERIAQIEQAEHRRVRGKEKTQLKDEVIFDMLPQAFTQSRLTFACIDTRNDWLLVDAATPARAEAVIELLRESLGSLPVRPMAVQSAPSSVMTQWLQQGVAEQGFELLEQCELRAADETGAVVRFSKHPLNGDEIQTHLAAGKKAVKLALAYRERIQCVVDDQLSIKQIKCLDAVLDEYADTIEALSSDDAAARFDADMVLMLGELRALLPSILDAFGGMLDD